jgi:hypothetical protein
MAEAAIGTEKPAIKETCQLKNPLTGCQISERKQYSPPAYGIASPRLPYDRAAQRVITWQLFYNLSASPEPG